MVINKNKRHEDPDAAKGPAHYNHMIHRWVHGAKHTILPVRVFFQRVGTQALSTALLIGPEYGAQDFFKQETDDSSQDHHK